MKVQDEVEIQYFYAPNRMASVPQERTHSEGQKRDVGIGTPAILSIKASMESFSMTLYL